MHSDARPPLALTLAAIGGLLFLEGVGSALTVSWMAPVGLAHALVLGLGTFAGSYLWLRFGRR